MAFGPRFLAVLALWGLALATDEKGLAFLAEKAKDPEVVTLASGLMYKALKKGDGKFSPTKDSPCEVHYAGALIDGTEFDSSYKRGSPTTFAPKQVIKGWTEAMQLMVEGDKWEMYIPYELAYGAAGKPPKIPAAAALIFIMEIVKIKGEKTAKAIVFPEWTAEQLALWTDADQAKVQAWADARTKSWEDGKLKDTHPTREGFDAWIAKQSLASRNKSLWTRTHKKAAPPTPAGPPQLTQENARALLTKALETFKQPANKEQLMAIVKECEGMDPQQAGMAKMMKLMPAVQTMMAGTIQEYGFGESDMMNVVMQVQAFGPKDPSIAADSAKLMKAVSGDFGDLLDA